MNIEGALIASFVKLRKGVGLTIGKLGKEEHVCLLQQLDAEGQPAEGYKRLTALVLGFRDINMTRAMRNALAIGDDVEPRKNLEARRRWADTLPKTGDEVSFAISRSQHCRFEEEGFQALARLIIRQHAQRKFLNAAMASSESAPLQTGQSSQPESDASEPDWDALTKRVNDIMRRLSRRAQYTMATFAFVGIVCYMINLAYAPPPIADYFYLSALTLVVEAFFIAGIIDVGRLPEKSSVLFALLLKTVDVFPSWHRESIDE